MPESKDTNDREKRLKMLRERLYSRGNRPPQHERRDLKDDPQEVKRTWGESPQNQDIAKKATEEFREYDPQTEPKQPMVQKTRRKKRSYRTTLILSGLIFFVVALILSSSFLFFGKNTISGDNITIGVNGPFAIGGGEELPLQIAIANQNAVPIESATLIIEYPFGTQSVEEPGRELFRDRKQLNQIKPGEVINIPIRAIVFGEENDEKTILISIEYRVSGSNAIFFKEAEPFRFKISSSPVVLSIDSVKRITSGQEVEITLTIASNAPSDISDVLVKAEYPFGFDYTESKPSPFSGRDTWLISKLAPEEEKEITIRGILFGKQDETQLFKFSVGVANERDRFSLASIFTTLTNEITIEQPFLDVNVLVGLSDEAEVVIPPNDVTRVSVQLQNTLSGTIYDGVVEVRLSGNALDESEIEVTGGFYDSSQNTITWDARSNSSLDEIQPGDTSTVRFTLKPKQGGDILRTPQITLDVTVKGKRISEDRVPQELTGTVTRTLKVASVAILNSEALYSTGPFTNTGPIPPEAEDVTTYSIVLSIKNGSNAVTDSEVSTAIPPYVTWLDLTTTGSVFSYNPVTRAIVWDTGDLTAGEEKQAAFQLSIFPSISQIDEIPTLVGEQRFRATDRFTGTTIRASSFALTTELSSDPDESTHDGRIKPKSE